MDLQVRVFIKGSKEPFQFPSVCFPRMRQRPANLLATPSLGAQAGIWRGPQSI